MHSATQTLAARGLRPTPQALGHRHRHPELRSLTETWGSSKAVALYLDRCQIDTPDELVHAVWRQISRRRRTIGKVVDFGAGDGRFARGGQYSEYLGYEIDWFRCSDVKLPRGASLINRCAFSDAITDADVCLGNPPFVRNQDLPAGWRRRAAAVIKNRTGVDVSGLANAWQYFALLALASTKADGIVALVIPYEWVSRPSARALRGYIEANGWEVDTYRLRDETFRQVLTTSSITIIDKRKRTQQWRFFAETERHSYASLPSPSGGRRGVLPYLRRATTAQAKVRVTRGLSPGTQAVLTLTEGQRVRAGLKIGDDVVPCVTSLRRVTSTCRVLTETVFRSRYRDAGAKCWIIRTDRAPSKRLRTYLDGIPSARYDTATCSAREEWWKFTMPTVPAVVVASGFRGQRPKAVVNRVNAIAVGSVSAVFGVPPTRAAALVKALGAIRVSARIVAHSSGLLKLEIGQLNSVIQRLAAKPSSARTRRR